jgi:hypothetical protein
MRKETVLQVGEVGELHDTRLELNVVDAGAHGSFVVPLVTLPVALLKVSQGLVQVIPAQNAVSVRAVLMEHEPVLVRGV